MKRRVARIAVLAVFAAAIASSQTGPTVPTDLVRGAALGLFATEPDYDYGDLLDELVSRDATDVLLVDVWVQDTVHATNLSRVSGYSPSPQTLSRTLAQARERGLRVGWMPIVVVAHREAGEWRGVLNPSDHSAWFASYRALLADGVERATTAGTTRVVIGSELTSLQASPEWSEVIRTTRERFDGTLTYAANWDAYTNVPFWSELDEIGVSAYFALADEGEPAPNLATATARLAPPLQALEHFGAAQQRPVVLLEVGFPALASAAHAPWDETRQSSTEPALQALLLRAFCAAEQERQLAGFYVWNWFGYGGPRDSGYALRGKPGASAFESCMQPVTPRSPEQP